MGQNVDIEFKFVNTDEFSSERLKAIKNSFINEINKGINDSTLMTKEKYYLDIIAKQQATIDRLREERRALLEAIEEYKYGKESEETKERT